MSVPGLDGEGAVSPTVLRRTLGANLRRLREAKGITRAQAGWQIRGSESKISRMELGRVSCRERDIVDLLTFYGVTDENERERLIDLSRDANSRGWWHRYSDVLSPWFQPYLDLEAATSHIRAYELQFVPGLLQTRDYAQAVIGLDGKPMPSIDVERRVEVRMGRQQQFARRDGPKLWVVMDEAILHRAVGGTKVMRAQIEALIDTVTRSNVTVQIMPFRAGGHAATGGAFSILRFAEKDLPDIVYIEHVTSALYLDRREDVVAYMGIMDTLVVQAEPPENTIGILRKALTEL